MNWLRILNKNEKKEIEKKLYEIFGIKKIPGIILKKGQERLFLFLGNIEEKKLKEIESRMAIERIGIYFAKQINNEIKLSIEGIELLKNQITKNIFELTEEQAEQWMHGQELLIKTGKKGYLAMKYKNDFLGCGKASAEKIGNYIPKSRRLKYRNQS